MNESDFCTGVAVPSDQSEQVIRKRGKQEEDSALPCDYVISTTQEEKSLCSLAET